MDGYPKSCPSFLLKENRSKYNPSLATNTHELLAMGHARAQSSLTTCSMVDQHLLRCSAHRGEMETGSLFQFSFSINGAHKVGLEESFLSSKLLKLQTFSTHFLSVDCLFSHLLLVACLLNYLPNEQILSVLSNNEVHSDSF